MIKIKSAIKKVILSIIPHFVKKHYLSNENDLVESLKKKHALISYSQQGEDLAIERFFQGKRSGFYVDVGAFDPVIYSNTKLFYDMGWTGINIEANSDKIHRFNTLRPKDINLNVGVSDEAGKLDYFVFNAPALNTFNSANAKRWSEKPGFEILKTHEVEVLPLKDILKLHLNEGQSIDFMTIDVEGWDLKVLASNDWQKFRPKLVLVEEVVKNCLSDSRVFSFLDDISYELWSIAGGTMIFKDAMPRQG